MADTITVLDGIRYAKDTDDNVWTVDGGVAGNEVVKTYAVFIPTDASGARVIFNAAEATESAEWDVRVKVTKTTGLGTLAKTENTEALGWTNLIAPAVVETGAIDVSAAYTTTLHIDMALCSTTAVTTGAEVIVQIRKEGSTDCWTDVARFMSVIGTGVSSDFAAEEAAGQTVLSVTNPATGKLDHVGRFIFLEDTGDITKCEIAFLVSQSGD